MAASESPVQAQLGDDYCEKCKDQQVLCRGFKRPDRKQQRQSAQMQTGTTDIAYKARRRATIHPEPSGIGVMRKIQLARMSIGKEKTTRVPTTQSMTSRIVEAMSAEAPHRVSHRPLQKASSASMKIAEKRIAVAKPTPEIEGEHEAMLTTAEYGSDAELTDRRGETISESGQPVPPTGSRAKYRALRRSVASCESTPAYTPRQLPQMRRQCPAMRALPVPVGQAIHSVAGIIRGTSTMATTRRMRNFAQPSDPPAIPALAPGKTRPQILRMPPVASMKTRAGSAGGAAVARPVPAPPGRSNR